MKSATCIGLCLGSNANNEICDSTSFGTRADYIQSLKLPNLKEGLLGQTCYMLKGEHACIENSLGL